MEFVNAADSNGDTALHAAASSEGDTFKKIVKTLLQYGADDSVKNNVSCRWTPVFCMSVNKPCCIIDRKELTRDEIHSIFLWLFATCMSRECLKRAHQLFAIGV